MTAKQPELESLVAQRYRHGFVTDIASDTVAPGLDEHVIRLISAKKGEPAFMLDTVYVSITWKTDPEHAPAGAENWFVLLNVASSQSGLSDSDVAHLRQRVLTRLDRSGFGVRSAIEFEHVIRPQDFQKRFDAFGGSIYGLSSNSRSAAFLRPANRVRAVNGLYLCGGSAHPGGGSRW